MNKKLPQVKVVANPNDKHVYIDGVDIPGIREVKFYMDASSLPVLQLELQGCDIEINGNFVPSLPEVIKDYYIPIGAEQLNTNEIFKYMLNIMKKESEGHNIVQKLFDGESIKTEEK